MTTCQLCGNTIAYRLNRKTGRMVPYDLVDGRKSSVSHFHTCPVAQQHSERATVSLTQRRQWIYDMIEADIALKGASVRDEPPYTKLALLTETMGRVAQEAVSKEMHGTVVVDGLVEQIIETMSILAVWLDSMTP